VQQVVGYLGYSGRDADVVVTAALDPLETIAGRRVAHLQIDNLTFARLFDHVVDANYLAPQVCRCGGA